MGPGALSVSLLFVFMFKAVLRWKLRELSFMILRLKKRKEKKSWAGAIAQRVRQLPWMRLTRIQSPIFHMVPKHHQE